MKRMGKFMVGLGLMGGLLLLAIPVQAEEGTQVEAWVDEEDGPRELIGHFFLPSSLLNTPFAVSEVKAGTAFAYAAYEPSAGVLASSLLLPSKLELAYLRPTFDMQFGLPAGFRLGATLESTVLSGVSTDAAFAFGAAVVVFLILVLYTSGQCTKRRSGKGSRPRIANITVAVQGEHTQRAIGR